MSENVRFRLAGGQNPLILVPVHVNERGPYEFILDTGASLCLISQELSATLGVPVEGEKEARGAAGPVRLGLGRVSSMTVGSARRLDLQVGITDELRRIAAVIRSPVDGDLGFDFLKDFALTIDYPASVLRLVPAPADGHASGSQPRDGALPFELVSASKPLILLPVGVNGEGPFQFAVDTGSSRTMLSRELAERLAIETIDDAPATGGGGQVEILAGKVESLTVGNATVRDLAIGAADFLTVLSAALGVELDGVLGYNFLNQFEVTIDYPRGTVGLVPAAPGAAQARDASS